MPVNGTMVLNQIIRVGKAKVKKKTYCFILFEGY
jgi:hypothetical protein